MEYLRIKARIAKLKKKIADVKAALAAEDPNNAHAVQVLTVAIGKHQKRICECRAELIDRYGYDPAEDFLVEEIKDGSDN